MKRLVFIWLLFSQTLAWADNPTIFEPKISNPITYNKVWIQNRNNEVGQQYTTLLRFENWTALPLAPIQKNIEIYRTSIGLTKSGHLYQHIQIDRNHFARRLSGGKCIKDFRVVSAGLQLLALGCDGTVFIFKHTQWANSPLQKIIKTRALKTALGISALSVVSYFVAHSGESDAYIQNMLTAMGSIFGGAAYSQVQLALGFVDFGRMNTRPDGLVPTKIKIESFDSISDGEIAALLLDDSIDGQWDTNCEALLQTKTPEGGTRHFAEESF